MASVIAYCTFGSVFGWMPLFATHGFTFDDPWQLVPYLALALSMIVLAAIYTRTFLRHDRLVSPHADSTAPFVQRSARWPPASWP